ncbi:MAG: 3'(2'),5'-bisphosphate nucleotidase CysQ [Candidatus Atelocyanobacterium thalassa]
MKLKEIETITRSIAWGAAKILHSYYCGKNKFKITDSSQDGPTTTADIKSNNYILKNLQIFFPKDIFGYLSEENYKYDSHHSRIQKDWVWIIDPLDGTKEFINKTGEYALHIALAYQGRPVVAVVAIPETQTIYFATKGYGTFVEDLNHKITQIKVSNRNTIENLSLVVSKSHRNTRFQSLIDAFSIRDIVYMGSLGKKITTILEQKADVYISISGKSAPKDWDFAAPDLILTEAGGKFTYFNGDIPFYNRGDVSQWGNFIASNGYFHEALCEKSINSLNEIDKRVIV